MSHPGPYAPDRLIQSGSRDLALRRPGNRSHGANARIDEEVAMSSDDGASRVCPRLGVVGATRTATTCTTSRRGSRSKTGAAGTHDRSCPRRRHDHVHEWRVGVEPRSRATPGDPDPIRKQDLRGFPRRPAGARRRRFELLLQRLDRARSVPPGDGGDPRGRVDRRRGTSARWRDPERSVVARGTRLLDDDEDVEATDDGEQDR